MKLLLTSAGITNQKIADALFDLVGKKPEETSLVFIPTASNVVGGDKMWLIDDLIRLKELHFKSIGIVDIAVAGMDVWQSELEGADVLFFEGGSTYYLMEWMNKSGLTSLIPSLLKDKVYVGISAGSMIASKDLTLNITQTIYGEDLDQTKEMSGLKLVDFYVLPHLNSEYFMKMREENIREAVKGISDTVYVLDDSSALTVVDGQVEVVSEGEYFVIA